MPIWKYTGSEPEKGGSFYVDMIPFWQNLMRLYLKNIQGPPIEIRKNPVKKCSAYIEATWTFNVSYERKFCGLLEYV